MPITVWAKVNQGKIELLEPMDLPEGARVLVTLVPSSEQPPSPEQSPEVLSHDDPDLWLQSEAEAQAEAQTEDLIWDNIDEESEPLLPLPASRLPLPRELRSRSPHSV
jgi:hypothetical protein